MLRGLLAVLVGSSLALVGLIFYSAFNPIEAPEPQVRLPIDETPTLSQLETPVTFLDMGEATGSGVFIAPQLILTVRHVANFATPQSTATTPDGQVFRITGVELRDDQKDIAILTVDKPYVGFLPQTSCVRPNKGDILTNIGNPMEMKWVLAKMIVSGDVRDISQKMDARWQDDLIFQGPAIGGQSGSPFFTAAGDIVGVLTIGFGDDNKMPTGLGGFMPLSASCDFLIAALNAENKIATFSEPETETQ